MPKTRSQMLSEKADAERQHCRDWLLPFMQNNQPKFLTKDELRSAAMRELDVPKLSFDMAWIMAIEDAGRHDCGTSRCAEGSVPRADKFDGGMATTAAQGHT